MSEPLSVNIRGKPVSVRTVTETGAPDGRDEPGNAPADGTGGASTLTDPAIEEMQSKLAAQREQLTQARKALEDALEKLPQLREKMIRESEEQLVELALEIARKVLMQEVQAGRYEIDPIVKEALLHVPARQDVTVHLHPDDWAACQTAREAEGSAAAGNVRFVADPSVRRAACLLETSEGTVESAVEANLENIAEALKEDSPNRDVGDPGELAESGLEPRPE